MKKLIVLLFFLITGINILAQETEDLVTDRPDQTESAYIVPRKSLQIETGFLVERIETDSVRTNSFLYNGTLLRFGLLENFEIRFGAGFASDKSEHKFSGEKFTTEGFVPVGFGFKVFIVEEGRGVPRLAFLGTITAGRTGSKDFRPDYWGSEFRFNGEYTISRVVSFGFNLGAAFGSGDAFATMIYTAVFGFSMGERWGAFVEAYGFMPEEQYPDHRLDAGFTFLALNNLQIDLSGGIGISDISPEHFVSAGLSWRIPR